MYIAFSNDKKQVSIGVSIDMFRRIKLLCAQSEKIYKVVYYEEYDNANEANRRYKDFQSFPKTLIKELVSENNPMCVDLLD